ncbi:MAG: hypothetical protein AAFX03_05045 [Pseudomonadota bacterium]
MGTLRTFLSWLLALALIAAFLHVTVHPLPNPTPGVVQLYDAPGENIVFQTLATKSGVALFEPAGRVLAALIQLVACFFLFIPGTRRFGAWLAMLVLGAAVAAHLSPWLGRELPLSLARGETETDGGATFSLALALLVGALLLSIVHPSRRR